jgi:type IV secretory pathway VirB10-like protein
VTPPVAPPPIEPAKYQEVVVPAESVLGLQVQTAISSETARLEDRVEARVTRDVRVGDRVAIPAGAQVFGSVVQVDPGGKMKDRAHFAIRFHTILLPDGTRSPLTAEAVHREGPSPANKTAAKIGGAAVGGAILGAILGGGKGAAIGSSLGAAGGTAAAAAGGRELATLPAGSIVNVRLMSPLTVTLDR